MLRYQPYDRLPIVHFGFLGEVLEVWAAEGRISPEQAKGFGDGTPAEQELAATLGFDFNWQNMFYTNASLRPPFPVEVVATLPDGSRHVRNGLGGVVVEMPGAGSIHAEIDHLLKDRATWEQHFKPRLQWRPERVTESGVWVNDKTLPFAQGGLEHLCRNEREKYGRDLRGVGGVNKRVFSRDRTAVDQEIERLRPLVELGGYIPCPDHRIPGDCKFELIQYYTERMREIIG